MFVFVYSRRMGKRFRTCISNYKSSLVKDFILQQRGRFAEQVKFYEKFHFHQLSKILCIPRKNLE